ncbi:condensation domain-containing protein [Paenibacillus larvae]|nr:condensation domain-containing protein [Paenibacillus larvae]MDT2237193.1 condensation domain-containing protein [Paenibacillus larvae]
MCMKRLDGSSNEIKNEWISQFLKQDREKGFDITMDSLIRLALLETGGGEWTIVLSFHHILMDGWCSDLIFNELFRIYDSLKQGAAVEWSPAQPYSQYIKWLEKQDKEAAARYWKTYLNGYEPMARLPQRKKDASLPYKPMEYRFSVDREVTEQLQRIAQQNQVTLNVLFQTIWGILVQKYNDQHSVVFGSVINGRPAAIPGVEQMIGLFINTLPVRVQTGENQSFQSLLHQMHEQMIQSHEFGFFLCPRFKRICRRPILI